MPGAKQAIGEVSGQAESQGVRPGMRVNEALARCPELRLVPPDPARAARVWEQVLQALEEIGAEVESGRVGEGFFAVNGLLRLYGGEAVGVLAAARARVPIRVRIAVAPTRFAAFAAASRGPNVPRPVSSPEREATSSLRESARAETIIPPGALNAFLALLPVATLATRLEVGEREAGDFVGALRRLGLRTLGDFTALSPDQVADRFGPLGLRALRLAWGEDTPLRPRRIHEEIAAEISLPEGTAGPQLTRALELLVDRLLAAPERRSRTVLGLRLDAVLGGGGSWSIEQGLSRATASASILCMLLAPKLAELPGPAESLSLRVSALGAAAPEQLTFADSGRPSLRSRLGESVRELRAIQGAESLLKVVDVDSRSRVPERRVVLTPYPDL